MKLLLAHGAKANVRSGDTLEMVKNGPIQLGRLTPLHWAAGQGEYETVAALLAAGTATATIALTFAVQ